MPHIKRSILHAQIDTEAEKRQAYEDRKIKEANYLYHRKRYLPSQLKAARSRLKALIKEANRYGMTHILEPEEIDT